MEISVCVDALFWGKDIMKSMKTVKASGFSAIEFWCWWDKNLDEIKQIKDELEMNIAAFCTKFISLVDASKREDYIVGLKESIEAAKKLDCKKLISQVGNEIPGLSREEQKKSLIAGLKQCAPILEAEGITLVIEPLNTLVDHKGYFLYSSDEAFEIIDEVNSPNVKVLFDIYHQQVMEGHLISRICNNIDKIGHFHAAGNPGRHELDKGELNYANIFNSIKETGSTAYVGLEYFPVDEPGEGLKKVRSLDNCV